MHYNSCCVAEVYCKQNNDFILRLNRLTSNGQWSTIYSYSQFCFPKSPDVSRDEVEFPEGCFVIYLDFPLNNHTLFYSVRGQQLG